MWYHCRLFPAFYSWDLRLSGASDPGLERGGGPRELQAGVPGLGLKAERGVKAEGLGTPGGGSQCGQLCGVYFWERTQQSVTGRYEELRGRLRGTAESRCNGLLQPMGTLSTGALKKLVLALMSF